jgi:hypothetical protein
MENYKGDFYSPESFEKIEIETKIPVDLVKTVDESLNNIEGYFVTPIIAKPEDLSVVFGVVSTTSKLKYRVSITHYEKV